MKQKVAQAQGMTPTGKRRRSSYERSREPLTGRPVLRCRADVGVDIHVAPMPGFTRAFGMITTRYGSVDTHLPDGTRLPDGIAHFLEHKMFQTEAGDVFDLYAARGASANAFTTFTHTSYLFSCTTGFRENLRTLLESMATIHTDKAGVEREKGIIGQELAMYEDDPGWRGYFNLLQALYRRHPVRIDIGGSADSIRPIDSALLARTHAAYYSPRNMVLTVAGDVDAEEVLALTETVLGACPRGRLNRRAPLEEPRGVARRGISERLSLSRPHVLLGLKDAPGRGPQGRVRRQVQGAMLMELLFGDGGRIQTPLYREGLVDDSFSAGYESEADYAFAMLSADVDEVEPYRRTLLKALRRVAREGFEDAEIERCRRRFLGRHLRIFNTPDATAHWLLGLALEGVGPSAGIDALQQATRRSLNQRLRELAGAPRAWSILLPR